MARPDLNNSTRYQQDTSKQDRRRHGQHFSDETVILRTIGPLFLNNWTHRVHTAIAQNDKTLATALNNELATAAFLDPAAGTGNFLTITYHHLAALNDQLRPLLENRWQPVTIHQFHGIEIDPTVADLGNHALATATGQPVSHQIVHGNALQLNWADLVPMTDGTYIIGNPPFLGSLMLDDQQKADTRRIWNGHKRTGTMDFVTNWFLLAARHMHNTGVRAAFVSTNSITQGEQPAVLWGEMYPLGVGIDFAYRTFPWRNGAGEQAAVHCVIIGFSATPDPDRPRLLWPEPTTAPDPVTTANITAYLTPGPDILIHTRTSPLHPDTPPMRFGSMPRDGGHLTKITATEADRIRATDPIAAKYLHQLIGADELLNGKTRYCLWLKDADPADLAASPELAARTTAVRSVRAGSAAISTRRAADTPHLFVQDTHPGTPYLAAPCYGTRSRGYLICDFFPADVIANNKVQTISNATPYTFAILSSRPFAVWHHTVSGSLGAAPNLSVEITYNNFPFPEPTPEQHDQITTTAQAVLAARAAHPNTPLGVLYGPETTDAYPNLTTAHNALDKAVLAVYGLPTEATDAEILTALFTRYATLTGPEPDDGTLF